MSATLAAPVKMFSRDCTIDAGYGYPGFHGSCIYTPNVSDGVGVYFNSWRGSHHYAEAVIIATGPTFPLLYGYQVGAISRASLLQKQMIVMQESSISGEKSWE